MRPFSFSNDSDFFIRKKSKTFDITLYAGSLWGCNLFNEHKKSVFFFIICDYGNVKVFEKVKFVHHSKQI